MTAPMPAAPTPPARLLWLVRHAEPLVAPGTCYGALDLRADAGATQRAAKHLAATLPARAHVVCSPLQRCEQLALALQALRPDLAWEADARLRELDFGAWEGQAWEAIARADIDAWTAAFASYRPGEGEHLASMLQRVAAALRSHSAAGAASDVVWITHAGVARCVAWLQAHGDARMPRSGEWPLAAPGWGEWQTVPLSPPADGSADTETEGHANAVPDEKAEGDGDAAAAAAAAAAAGR